MGPSDEYMKSCSLSTIEDILYSWNYPGSGCCLWHAHLQRLSQWLREMSQWHSCVDKWKPAQVERQCGTCLALLHAERDAGPECWLCNSSLEDCDVDDFSDSSSLRRRRGYNAL